MADHPVERPLAVKLLFARLSVVRLTTLVAQSDEFGLNDVSLLPERSSEVREVIPVPQKVVSLLFEKANVVIPVLLLRLSVVRAGRSPPVNHVLRPVVVRRFV